MDVLRTLHPMNMDGVFIHYIFLLKILQTEESIQSLRAVVFLLEKELFWNFLHPYGGSQLSVTSV